jgi:hypothetical protein
MRAIGLFLALLFCAAPPALAQDSPPPPPIPKKKPVKPPFQLKQIVGDWAYVQILVKSRTVTLKNGKTVRTKPITRTIQVSFKADGTFVMAIRHLKNKTEKSQGKWKLDGRVILTRFADDVTWTKTIIVSLKNGHMVVKDSASGHKTDFSRLN